MCPIQSTSTFSGKQSKTGTRESEQYVLCEVKGDRSWNVLASLVGAREEQ